MTHEIEKFWDHDMAQQTEYEKYLVSQGIVSQSEIDKGREKYKTWKKEDWQKFKHEGDEINNAILKALQKNLKPDSNEVQKLIKNHFEWVKRFWTPDREKYINLGKMYCTHADFEKYFEKFDPKFAKFLAQAMKVYAENNLS